MCKYVLCPVYLSVRRQNGADLWRQDVGRRVISVCCNSIPGQKDTVLAPIRSRCSAAHQGYHE